jgi:FkbM family methyltransferase
MPKASMKELIKKWVKRLPIAFTRNQQYDRQTRKVIAKVCSDSTNFIDVGCHKGEVLDIVLHHAPNGIHYGFEPIPNMYEALVLKYANRANCHISNVALSKESGTATFNYVMSNPSYSGLRKRQYDRSGEQDTTITVVTEQLDRFLPTNYTPHLIKIDVEGAELFVLEGAAETLRRCQPIVIFEHGLGASEFYEATPERVYDLFAGCNMQVSLMKRWLKGQPALTKAEFSAQFHQKTNYYFIAYGSN